MNKIYLLNEVASSSSEPIELIAQRLGLSVETVERLKILAKRYRIIGGK